jgi:hypothetical protein
VQRPALLIEGYVGDLAVEVVGIAGGAILVVVGFGRPVAAGVSSTDGEVGGVGLGEADSAGECALELPVEVEGLATAGGGEDGVVPEAVVNDGGGGDGSCGAVLPFGVKFAVGADVQDRVVAAGIGGAGGQGLVLEGGQQGNRVNPGNYPELDRFRIQQVVTETGARISVSYELTNPCSPSSYPSPSSDTSSCFPVYWQQFTPATGPDWFNKYAVASVAVTD